MSENETSPVTEAEVLGKIIKDPEIRKMPPGSDEYKVAVEKLSAGKTATEATDDAKGDDQASTEDTADSESGHKPKSGLEKRFSKLTGERDEARREKAALEARLAALEAKTPARTEPEVAFQPENYNVAKPSVDKFDTYADYVEALTDWKADQRDFMREQKQQMAKVQEMQKEVVHTWETREKTTKDRVEGYDQLVNQEFIGDFTKEVASQVAMQYLLESDVGPDLLFELAEDDAKLAGFKGMSAAKQVAYLTKLEAKYEQDDEDPKSKSSTVTKAPAPSKSLPKGKTNVTRNVDVSRGVQSFADYQVWRKQNSKQK